jgi:hypothetical protein
MRVATAPAELSEGVRMDSPGTAVEKTNHAPNDKLLVSKELEFWCGVLGISEQQLARAIKDDGMDAGAHGKLKQSGR